jgi:hypothetical protein
LAGGGPCPRQLGNIENGQHEPRTTNACRLARVLGMSLDQLTAAEGAPFTITVRV